MRQVIEHIWNMPAGTFMLWLAVIVIVLAIPFGFWVAHILRSFKARNTAYSEQRAGFDRQRVRVERELNKHRS